MTQTKYAIPILNNGQIYTIQDALKEQLPDTVWDGSRVRGTKKGWNSQLGKDVVPFRDYVHTHTSDSDEMKLTLFDGNIQDDYSPGKLAEVRATIDRFVN